MKNFLKVALIGNPNCGKTTVFNNITGFRQRIGNYPGVTIEKKEGFLSSNNVDITMVDLPGIYSLTAHSEEELVARNYILVENPDIVVNIVDSSNLEKSLFLTTQLTELDIPVLLVLNMVDIAKARDIKIDHNWLSKLLEIKICEIIANKKIGIKELLKEIIAISKHKSSVGVNVKFEPIIENEILKIEDLFSDKIPDKDKRFLALKLLEEDKQIQKRVQKEDVLHQVEKSIGFLEKNYKDHVEVVTSKQRHLFIHDICKKAISRSSKFQKSRSDKIDDVLTHPFFGILFFLGIMYLMFQLTFFVGAYPTGWLEIFFKYLGNTISNFWPDNSDSILKSLIVKGIIGGVGSVIVFLPNILLLFFSISILEETGYMARAAFILDKYMHKIGLHGKSFIPMLIGFGCSVPAIMATRTMECKKDRLITILALPLIACSAKLVVFTLIIPAFFSKAIQPLVLFSLYIIGIALAILVIKILRLSIFKKESFSFVMELPPYRLPTIASMLINMWDKGFQYIKKAGTLILGFSVVIWFLSYFPINKTGDVSQTYIGKIGAFIEPIFKPLGFDWKINTSLISSFVAKEVFIAQLGIIYAIKDPTDSHALQNQLSQDYSTLQAFCIMLFILISTPCIATIAVTKKETNSYKWALFQFSYLTLLAYFVTMLVYQSGIYIQRFLS